MTSSLANTVSEHEDGTAQGDIGGLECLLEGKTETEPLQERLVVCVGPCYLRLLHANYAQADGKNGDHCLPDEVTETLEDDLEESEDIFEDDIEYLRSLDPKEWKNQDHYAVLGLRKLRIKATEDDIKRAYRMKVLKHHPDKRRAAGEKIIEADDYFTCITMAWEMLKTPNMRRAFDSVDPEFDDDIPTATEAGKEGFYKSFGPVFLRNAIWSENTPVPKLGNGNSSREEVEKFYAFWFNFVSWREYSYNDDEEAKTGQDRDTRKWVEKQNKAQRAKLKKEEMARIRRLVETSYECDPRVQKFRQDDKESKLAQKQARQNAILARKEEEERVRQEQKEKEQKEKEEKEKEEKAAQDVQRKQREAAKNALRKEKKALRTLCKDNNYFAGSGDDSVQNMIKMESMCDVFPVNELSEITQSLQGMSLDEGSIKFKDWVARLNARLEKERAQVMESAAKGSGGRSKTGGGAEWLPADLQLLIKAVNLFPAGTSQRWEVVANFVNLHSSNKEVQRSAKEVLAKTKSLQSSDYSTLKDAANKKAYEDFEKGQKGVATVADSEASERFDTPAEQQGVSSPWTAAEQQLLEQALRSYPASTPDRWDRIAECIPSRTKKECLKRFKELAEIVKAKKAAQAKVQKAGK